MNTIETNMDRLQTLLDTLPTHVQGNVRMLVAVHQSRIAVFPGASRFHHTERGGWLRHVLEVYDIAQGLNQMVAFRFNRPEIDSSEMFLAAFLHDFAKLYTYRVDPNSPTGYSKITDRWRYINPEVWTLNEVASFNLHLNEEVINAILMAEGGWSAFARENTHSNRYGGDSLPLAVLIHSADMISAKILGPTGCSEEEGNGG
jgi:hypothetical protein